MKKHIYDNQLQITGDLNYFPVISHQIKPSDFLTPYKGAGLGLKNIHHKINFRSHHDSLYMNKLPYGWLKCEFDGYNTFSLFNQPYFKTN
ncbi:MAG: hypothetical protein CMP76_12210 [Flavobacterium sp.]|uniref:hypothetical protein n=1 Tax=Flavobacterium sp. TaxID=239 RepID=UPI000C476A07|nr:hypothetical protein [Flavobacterium sp.]MBF04049.1 hypothetical protein [Flavobacterium sp.]|tara:strand:+ start:451 stop:720 length:270 start_codon:yes stop_codon:yes gene_type:complete